MTAAPGTRSSRVLGVLLVALVALGSAVIALGAYALVAARSQRGASDALMAAHLEPGSLPATLPLRVLGGAWVVDATVGDERREAATLMLDTGAPTTFLPALADRVAGPPVGTVEEVSVTGDRVTRDVVPVGSIGLGGATIADAAAVAGSLSLVHPLRCVTEDGLLGADAMSDAVWQLDPSRGRLTIASSMDGLGHVEGESAIALPFTPSTDASPSPIVELPTATGRLRVVLDTGSDGWLAVHPDDLEAAGGRVAQDAPSRYATMWTTGPGPFTRIRYGTVDVTLGPERVADLPVATIEALEPGLGVVGTGFLRHFVLTIDWPGRTIVLDPLDEDGVASLAPAPPLLATVGWDGDGLTVSSFVDVPEAAEAGLAIGLPVRAVDGREAASLTLREACALALGPPAPYQLTRSDGTTVPVGAVVDYLGSPT
jgi:hypothetical protein